MWSRCDNWLLHMIWNVNWSNCLTEIFCFWWSSDVQILTIKLQSSMWTQWSCRSNAAAVRPSHPPLLTWSCTCCTCTVRKCRCAWRRGPCTGAVRPRMSWSSTRPITGGSSTSAATSCAAETATRSSSPSPNSSATCTPTTKGLQRVERTSRNRREKVKRQTLLRGRLFEWGHALIASCAVRWWTKSRTFWITGGSVTTVKTQPCYGRCWTPVCSPSSIVRYFQQQLH